MTRTAPLLALALLALLALTACGRLQKPLVCATDPRFPPNSFIKEGKFSGMDIDIAHAIAAHQNRDVTFTEAPMEKIFSLLGNGEADFALAGISITRERKASVHFSKPYYKTGLVVVSRKDAPVESEEKLSEVSLGIVKGTFAMRFVREKYNQLPATYTTLSEISKALDSGTIKAAILDATLGRAICSRFPDKAITCGPISEELYGVAVSKQNPDCIKLLETINDTLTEMDQDDGLKKLAEKWEETYLQQF